VLEIGTGCGYQTAVLAELAGEVFSIELVEALAADAARRLRRLGYDTVRLRCGDGYRGWPEEAPFDAILVTAGATHVPAPLIAQLKPGGRMVIPVGPTRDVQSLRLLVKRVDGTLEEDDLIPVVFVPLTGPNAADPTP